MNIFPLSAVLFLGLIEIIAISLPQVTGIPSYLGWHQIMETISIIVSMMVVAVSWQRSGRESTNIVILGAGLWLAGTLDLIHTISYLGMPSFFTDNTAQKQLFPWLLARLSVSIALLIVALNTWRPTKNNKFLYELSAATLISSAILVYLTVFHPDIMPPLYVPSEGGLTAFKKNFEYVIIAMNIITAIIMFTKMKTNTSTNTDMLLAAVIIMAMGEFYFTLYTTQVGSYNILGHMYKAIAYMFIYKAIVVEIIEKPFNDLLKSEDKFRVAVNAAPNAMVIVNDKGTITLVNNETVNLFGYTHDELIGQNVSILVPADVSSDHLSHVSRFVATEQNSRRMGSSQKILYGMHKTGTKIPVLIGLSPIQSGCDKIVIASIVNMADSVEHERELSHMANYDSLTELPNRKMFTDSVNSVLETHDRRMWSIAVLFLDIDNFKTINDSLGHHVGDLLLVEISKRLKTELRADDMVARIGGDEFVVMVRDVTEESAMRIAKHMCDIVSKPYILGDTTVNVTTSVGIAMCPQNGTDFPTLHKHADIAMYSAKKAGKNQVAFFTDDMQTAAVRLLTIETELRTALQNKEFSMVYQPQLDIRTNTIVSAEALIRWNSEKLGLVSPAEFIPIAEAGGYITSIGDWIIETVSRQTSEWVNKGMDIKEVAINISAVQFRQPELPERISISCYVANLPPKFLELELTESSTMDNVGDAIEMMGKLHDKGFHIAIDDFGTGYSSLSVLKRFDVNIIKIDQSFVKDIMTDPNDRAIALAIIQMAHSLGYEVTAEGVETHDQLALLTEFGCDKIQGYHVSRPLPPDSFEDFFVKYNHPQT